MRHNRRAELREATEQGSFGSELFGQLEKRQQQLSRYKEIRQRIVDGAIIPEANGGDIAVAVGAGAGLQLNLGLTQVKAKGKAHWRLAWGTQLLDHSYGAYAGVGYARTEAVENLPSKSERAAFVPRRLLEGTAIQEQHGAFVGFGLAVEELSREVDIAADSRVVLRSGAGLGYFGSNSALGIFGSLQLTPNYRSKELRRIDRWLARFDAFEARIVDMEGSPGTPSKVKAAERALQRLERAEAKLSDIESRLDY